MTSVVKKLNIKVGYGLLIGGYFSLMLLWSCGGSSGKVEFTHIEGHAQGTTYHISYYDALGREFQPEIDKLLEEIDYSMSTYVPHSVISVLNSGDTIAIVDRHFQKVFTKSKELYKITGGAFDPTIKALIDLWGFGEEEIVPVEHIDSLVFDSVLNLRGMDQIVLTGNKLVKQRAEVQLDFNAIAQGYAVDAIAELLRESGIINYMIELGGEVLVLGHNSLNEPWKIGVDMPEEDNKEKRELKAVVSISNAALATSGNYRKFYEKDGVKFSHTIDPRTGYPVKDKLLSATILAETCMEADALATACMVLGYDKAVEFIEKYHFEAYLIYAETDVKLGSYVTPKLKEKLEEKDS